MNGISIEKIYDILRNQKEIKWQGISPYGRYINSFEAHAYKHPISEKYTKRWNLIINYNNKDTILDSYYRASIDLPNKCTKYDLQFNEKHYSYNILDKNTGLMVCLKLWKNKLYIATCYFPSKKVISLFYKNKENTYKDFNNFDLNFTMYIDDNVYDINNANVFKEAMEEFFGSSSIEYKILFENKKNNIDDVINNIVTDTTEYLETMENLIKDEEDKKYYFVYDDGIEYVIRLSLLYKIKDKNYEGLYRRFLNIDLNNSYKDALDECKKYIDEGEENEGNN